MGVFYLVFEVLGTGRADFLVFLAGKLIFIWFSKGEQSANSLQGVVAYWQDGCPQVAVPAGYMP